MQYDWERQLPPAVRHLSSTRIPVNALAYSINSFGIKVHHLPGGTISRKKYQLFQITGCQTVSLARVAAFAYKNDNLSNYFSIRQYHSPGGTICRKKQWPSPLLLYQKGSLARWHSLHEELSAARNFNISDSSGISFHTNLEKKTNCKAIVSFHTHQSLKLARWHRSPTPFQCKNCALPSLR